MNTVIIKYNAGNIQSVSYALERLGASFHITDEPEAIRAADKVIFPGVGEASTTMRFLREHKLDGVILSLKQPVLGICLGMQLMCRYSHENNTECLGIFPDEVVPFNASPQWKVPHMGWNTLQQVAGWIPSSMEGQYAYFVHSYYVPVNNHTVAVTDYQLPFSAALQKDNFYAVQFHPEKSADAGEQILQSFLSL
jgi:glutamine amidotransferase